MVVIHTLQVLTQVCDLVYEKLMVVYVLTKFTQALPFSTPISVLLCRSLPGPC